MSYDGSKRRTHQPHLKSAGFTRGEIMKSVIALLLFSISAMAQQQSPSAERFSPACGPLNINFSTATSNVQPPVQPDAGKALVFVAEEYFTQPGSIGAPTLKIGLDGSWVGATHDNSYIFFMVDPGEHHLCLKWQSVLQRFSRLSSFARLSAEPGKTYYFRARPFFSQVDLYLDLDAIDPDEGRYLVASSPFSESHAKK
jgi:hypothetical protein